MIERTKQEELDCAKAKELQKEEMTNLGIIVF